MTEKIKRGFWKGANILPDQGGIGRNDGDKPGAGPEGVCICPECGFEIAHETNNPCNTITCPKCDSLMTRK